MSGNDMVPMDERARAVLVGNDQGGYTLPTAGLYPYQWNWDSAFAGLGFATFDVNRAWEELESLFAGQWPNGMVPHILFRKNDPGYFPGPDVWGTEGVGPMSSSGISQPPLAASFVRYIWEQDKDAGRARLQALLPKMKAWHDWFMQWRSSKDDAIFIAHPWEAGRDNSADWDEAMAMLDPVGVGEYTRRDTDHVDPSMRPTKEDYDRYLWLVKRGRDAGWDEATMAKDIPFAVADPTQTFALLRSNRDLSDMARELGEDTSDIDAWTARLEKGAASLLNPETGFYDAINLRTGKHSGHVTNASFLCWYAGIESEAMLGQVKKALSECAFPIPSLAIDSPKFEGLRYWRGPTWAILNSLIGRGLAEFGHVEEAEELRRRTASLISKHGFSEYFHPQEGTPGGGGSFTWTAAVWLVWASPTSGGF